MRFQKFLLIATTLIVALIALFNLESLSRPASVFVPILGVYSVPTRLFGLLAIVLLGVAFYASAQYAIMRVEASRVHDLERIEDLRRALDVREAGRIAALEDALEAHSTAVLSKLEALRSGNRPAPVPAVRPFEDVTIDMDDDLAPSVLNGRRSSSGR